MTNETKPPEILETEARMDARIERRKLLAEAAHQEARYWQSNDDPQPWRIARDCWLSYASAIEQRHGWLCERDDLTHAARLAVLCAGQAEVRSR